MTCADEDDAACLRERAWSLAGDFEVGEVAVLFSVKCTATVRTYKASTVA